MALAGNINSVTAAHKQSHGGVFLGSPRGKEGSGESHETAALNSKSCSVSTVHIAFPEQASELA